MRGCCHGDFGRGRWVGVRRHMGYSASAIRKHGEVPDCRCHEPPRAFLLWCCVPMRHHNVCNIMCLQAVSKVFLELGCKLLLPMAYFFEAAKEEAQNAGLLHPLQAADDLAVVPKPFHTVGHVLDL